MKMPLVLERQVRQETETTSLHLSHMFQHLKLLRARQNVPQSFHPLLHSSTLASVVMQLVQTNRNNNNMRQS